MKIHMQRFDNNGWHNSWTKLFKSSSHFYHRRFSAQHPGEKRTAHIEASVLQEVAVHPIKLYFPAMHLPVFITQCHQPYFLACTKCWQIIHFMLLNVVSGPAGRLFRKGRHTAKSEVSCLLATHDWSTVFGSYIHLLIKQAQFPLEKRRASHSALHALKKILPLILD